MPRIAVLTTGAPHAWVVINALVERFGPVAVLVEKHEGRAGLLRRRIRQQGALAVAGQAAFVILQRFIERRSRGRVAEIVREHGLDPKPNPACPVYPVGSVNSLAARTALAMLKPEAVLVIGTRLIGRETLAAVQVPLINFHSGITPQYRGQAGGYWALAHGDRTNAGVTLHLVDAGVDTGDIVYQAPFTASPHDNFSTYFWLQAAAGRSLAVRALDDALAGTLKPQKSGRVSKKNFHPTLWGYLWIGYSKQVW